MRRSWGCERKEAICNIAVFEDGGRGLRVQKCRRPAGVGEVMKWILP